MDKKSEKGRLMLEMLGVLAVIGVLGVGGMAVVTRAIKAHKKGQIITDAANLATNTKKLACQYTSEYDSKGSYSAFLYKSEAYPKSLTYNSTTKSYSGEDDVVYKIEGFTKTVSGVNYRYFYIKISELDEETCMDVATTDWGRYNTNGHVGVAIGTGNFGEFMHSTTATNEAAVRSSSTTYPMPAATAASYCSGYNNTVQLWYAACNY